MKRIKQKRAFPQKTQPTSKILYAYYPNKNLNSIRPISKYDNLRAEYEKYNLTVDVCYSVLQAIRMVKEMFFNCCRLLTDVNFFSSTTTYFPSFFLLQIIVISMTCTATDLRLSPVTVNVMPPLKHNIRLQSMSKLSFNLQTKSKRQP